MRIHITVTAKHIRQGGPMHADNAIQKAVRAAGYREVVAGPININLDQYTARTPTSVRRFFRALREGRGRQAKPFGFYLKLQEYNPTTNRFEYVQP